MAAGGDWVIHYFFLFYSKHQKLKAVSQFDTRLTKKFYMLNFHHGLDFTFINKTLIKKKLTITIVNADQIY